MDRKQIRHEIIVRMPEPFIRLLIDVDRLHDYIEGMKRHIMFRQMYKKHPFDIVEYLTREMQWDFEYHLAAFNADPSKYQSITTKKVNRKKCRINYNQINTARHILIAELMPYKLIHFLIENKAFKDYIENFAWEYMIFDKPYIDIYNLKMTFNSKDAINFVLKRKYSKKYPVIFNYNKWTKLSEKYKEYFINSL